MLNMEGEVTEGSGDNVFIVKNGKVITPPSDAGILEGITRRFVIDGASARTASSRWSPVRSSSPMRSVPTRSS